MDNLESIDIFPSYILSDITFDIVPDIKYSITNISEVAPVPFASKLRSDKCPCGKWASYGTEDNPRRLFCANCKPEGYVLKGKNKCACGKVATFGLPGTRKTLTCAKCKLPEYVDVVTKKCPCGKAPSYGCPRERKKIACKRCKLPHHIRLLYRKRSLPYNI